MNGYLLNDLEDGDRIIYVCRVPGGVEISEACDGWFKVTLTNDRLEQFISDLRAVAAEVEPQADQQS